MSSSGSSSIGGTRRRTTLICGCGEPSIVYTSRTLQNPNRAFFGCTFYKENKPYCNFFRWMDTATNLNRMELEEDRLNRLELYAAEMDFKLKYVEMKLNEQMKVNECLQVRLKEQEMKHNDLCLKMVADFDMVDKKIRHLYGCGRLLAGIITVVFIMCIYGGKKAPSGMYELGYQGS